MSAEEARGTGETTNIGEPTGTGEYSAQSAPSEAPQAASSIIPSLEVKVVDTKNPPAPIADATVSVVQLSTPPIPIGSQKTDQNGIAVFSPLLPGLYLVRASKDGYGEVTRYDVIVTVGRTSITIALPYRVVVNVVDNTNNRPIAGAVVIFRWTERISMISIRETDSQGVAVFHLAHRDYSFTVMKGGYAAYSGTVTVDRPNMSITVRLNPSSAIPPLTVVTVQNVPKDIRYTIPYVNVEVYRFVHNRDPIRVASGTTDVNGRISFSNVDPARYMIAASKEGHRSGSATIDFPQQSEVYVELKFIGVKLEVEVINAQTGARIRGADVTVKRGDQVVASGKTNDYGIAFFELDSDEYVVEARAQGFEPASTNVVLAQDQRVTVALAPPVKHYLDITVVDYKGRPISEATVTVYRGGQRVDSRTTGTDGKVTFQLEQGSYTVEAFKSGYKQPVQISVNLDRDKTEQLTLPGYRLTVLVKDSRTGQPITGATVKVFDQITGNQVDEGTTA